MTGDRLAVCYGTRPQVIKASVLIETLAERWPLLTIDTGQHYDYELHRLLYAQLGVPEPDHCLNVRASTSAEQVAEILSRTAAVLARERPWAVVVFGDTNSTLACALAGAQMRIPVVHVEAGLRVGDASMVEEVNRRLVDVIGALLCAPSAAAASRLRDERVQGTIAQTGDIARDVLLRCVDRIPSVESFDWWPLRLGEPFLFATLHRAELTDDTATLRSVLSALGKLDAPVILPAHPRLRAAIDHESLEPLSSSIHVFKPLGYLETLACIRNAMAVVTDSGGVQREGYWLGTPCITLRHETEWTETVDLGANIVVPPSSVGTDLRRALDRWTCASVAQRRWHRDAYGCGDAAACIRDAIDAAVARAGSGH